MSEEFCLIHGYRMEFDKGSGFYLCRTCERIDEARRTAVTEYVFPPIPDRRFDWLAYEASSDETGPFGWGATRQEAIDDLAEQIGEE